MAQQKPYHISQLANSLTQVNGVFSLAIPAQSAIKENNGWAMLLSEDGNVIWSENLPSDVPLSYSVYDVASFTKWYLKDYPVYVWQHPDGLFVLGYEKGTVWKHGIEMPQAMMDHTLLWVPTVLIVNCIAAILLSLLFGLRFFRSLKPLANGIEELSENRAVVLSTRGLLSPLASGINKASNQLQRQDFALKRRDNARTTWIAAVSHDIRTPLSLVMGYASQLEQDSELPAYSREQASVIRSQSERIKALIEDLNLVSKLEYDMQPIRKTVISLAALVRSIAADYLNRGLSSDYTLEVVMNENAQNAKALGDEQLLRRAISNLIANSIGHNPNGCAITITLETNDSCCSLLVSDNGVGFAPKTLTDLNAPKDKIELSNHGLGLTIVRQILKAHGGTTGVRNALEGGCTIELCLPLQNSDV
jgi:signal transduction histidine kinase